ncbi:hypothetical protein BS78_01G491700 [Paspalum vaginatum]|nr:hypothetical protein BS78_01G491700 [Paspalum vaginatum]
MDRLVPNTKKAMEDREEKPKVPARDPDLGDLMAAQQPQLQREHQPPNISEMKPLTREAYGGGMYAAEEGARRGPARPRASATQSADGEREQEEQAAPTGRLGHPAPPSTGDRDLDITGQSYIQ